MTAPARVVSTLPSPWVGQLETGAPTRASDCGVVTQINLILSTSGNTVGPRNRGEFAEWVKWVRRIIGVPSGPTGTDDWVKLWRSPELRGRYRAKGLQMPSWALLSGASWARMREHLRAGRHVALCVDYGELRDGPAPVGPGGFRGGHALMLAGLSVVDDLVWTNDCDPLRTTGPVVTRLAYFRTPAGEFGVRSWGVGKVEALSVRRAVRLPDAEPVPAPPTHPEVTAEIARLRGLAQQLHEGLTALEARDG